MPTYNQAKFIARAIQSLKLQTHCKWELIIVNDASVDDTEYIIGHFMNEQNIRCITNSKNFGLGASLNIGLKNAKYDLIAYLPSDDIYFKDHLESLLNILKKDDNLVVAYSGIRYHQVNNFSGSFRRSAEGQIDGYDVQLVQVLHRRTECLWRERREIVTDSLFDMFWGSIIHDHCYIETKKVTCEWTFHSEQRHRTILETFGGGLNKFKATYQIDSPINFQPSVGKCINEIEQYGHLRGIRTNGIKDRLKILVVGELAYNEDRIYSLEEAGHQLYGLWIDNPNHYNAIGPLPFGNIQDVPKKNWRKTIDEIQPDIIYALLNFQAVPLAHEVMMSDIDIPFVWHFKEGPFVCRVLGIWSKLIDLYSFSSGQIYINSLVKEWFSQSIVEGRKTPSIVLDGDLPSSRWFVQEKSDLLSTRGEEIHTLVAGRLIGLQTSIVKEIVERKIHLHFYGNRYYDMHHEWLSKIGGSANDYLHFHPNCIQKDWVKEFSQYDAGWLHIFKSDNDGEIIKASWDDLNYPARIATLAVSGVPLLQRSNNGHHVATQTLINNLDIGVLFDGFDDLYQKLNDKLRMKQIRKNVWRNRHLFTFDHHVDRLVSFFREVIIDYHS